MQNTEEDTRNVIDKFKGKPIEEIVRQLDATRNELEIAVENVGRDFNMGTIVRNANAFNVKKVHIIGSRQWNKRGAMKTDAYLHLEYHATPEVFVEAMRTANKVVIAVDIVEGALPLSKTTLPLESVLVFGAEGPGLSAVMLEKANRVVMIEQFGSTRSINVGVASGIVMYAWVQQHTLPARI